MGRLRFVTAVLILIAASSGTILAQSIDESARWLDLATDSPRPTPAIDWLASPSPGALRLCDLGETSRSALLGTFRVGALELSRSHAKAAPSAQIVRASDNQVLFDTTDLGLGTAWGPDITALAALNGALELEMRYFGLNGWKVSQTASDPAGVNFIGFGATVPGDAERAEYASRLYSFEMSIRPRVSEGIAVTLGFRTLQLHEHFGLAIIDPPPESPAIGTHVNNYLYGFQVGAEPYLAGAGSPLRLDGMLKAGIYGNHAAQGTDFTAGSTSLEAGRNRVSFVGEIGLAVDYKFSQFLALRAGYELLWLYGVALAPDQSATTDLLTSSAALNDSATAFYQGAMASLEFIF